MKRIKKYDNFYFNEILLESVLKVDPNFLKILKSMSNGDKIPIASRLYRFIDYESDIETNYNYITPSKDKNDEIGFIPDSQAKRVQNDDEGFGKKPNFSKIGRFIRQIMSNDKHTTFRDSDIEAFVNSYKSTWDLLFSNTSDRIKIVEGEEIRKWYDQNNYQDPESGELGNSCMRHSSKSDYFGLYEKNPDKVKLVIFLDDKGLLLGRSLWWKLDTSDDGHEYFLDRIYTRYDSDKEIISNWIANNFKDEKIGYYKNKNKNISVKLTNVDFEKYPYVDSFQYLYKDDKYISSEKNMDYPGELYEMSSTGGGIDLINFVKCKFEDKKYHYKDVYKSSYGYYVPKSKAVKDEIHDTFIHEDDVIYSDFYKSKISKENSVVSEKYGILPNDKARRVYTKYDEEGDVSSKFVDFYPTDLRNKAYIEYNYNYYSTDLCVKNIWDEWIPSALTIQIYYDSSNKYKSQYLTKLDVYLFDIDTTGMKESNSTKETYLDKYYRENREFYYDDFIKMLDSLDKDPEKIKEKKDEAKEYHSSELYEYGSYRESYLRKRYGELSDIKEKFKQLMVGFIETNKEAVDEIIKAMAEYMLSNHEGGDHVSYYLDITMDKLGITDNDITIESIKRILNEIISPYIAYYISNDLSRNWSGYDFRRVSIVMGKSEEYSTTIRDIFLMYVRDEDFKLNNILYKLIEDKSSDIKLLSSVIF